jgi:hypothetical protein
MITDYHDCGDFVKEQTLYRYTVKCFCGETWAMTYRQGRSARFIAELMAEECWTLDDDDHPQCTQCRRNIARGMAPTDPTNLGSAQKDILLALREHGMWHNRGSGCGWVWDNRSNTKKVLDSLVRRGLVELDEKGTYTPK